MAAIPRPPKPGEENPKPVEMPSADLDGRGTQLVDELMPKTIFKSSMSKRDIEDKVMTFDMIMMIII